MFEAGQLVIYENNGVCRIDKIGNPPSDFPQEYRERKYYYLTELYGNNTIYVPIKNKNYMRPILSKNEAMELIRSIPKADQLETDDMTQKRCESDYKALISSHDCDDLIILLKTVYDKSQSALDNGKKPWILDMEYCEKAEKLLFGELAAALSIPFENVREFISETIKA